MVALSLSLSYIITFPWVFWLLRRRFGGRIDGKRLIIMHVKALIAGAAACACGLFLNPLVTRLVGAKVSSVNGHMSWWQSIVICAILTIVVTAVYAGLLWLMRVEEFSSLIVTMKARLLRRTSTATSVSTPAESQTEEAQAQNAEVEEGITAIAENDNHYDNHSLGDDGTSENDGSAERAAETVTDLERPVQDQPVQDQPRGFRPTTFRPASRRRSTVRANARPSSPSYCRTSRQTQPVQRQVSRPATTPSREFPPYCQRRIIPLVKPRPSRLHSRPSPRPECQHHHYLSA